MIALVGAFNKEKALEGAFSGHCEISRSPVDSSTAVPLTTSAHQSSSLAPTLIIWFNCGINTDHGSLPNLCKIVCKNLKNNNAVTFCQRKPQTAVNICIVHSLPVVRSHGWIYFQPILVNRRHHHQLWALGWLLHSIIAESESCLLLGSDENGLWSQEGLPIRGQLWGTLILPD